MFCTSSSVTARAFGSTNGFEDDVRRHIDQGNVTHGQMPLETRSPRVWNNLDYSEGSLHLQKRARCLWICSHILGLDSPPPEARKAFSRRTGKRNQRRASQSGTTGDPANHFPARSPPRSGCLKPAHQRTIASSCITRRRVCWNCGNSRNLPGVSEMRSC